MASSSETKIPWPAGARQDTHGANVRSISFTRRPSCVRTWNPGLRACRVVGRNGRERRPRERLGPRRLLCRYRADFQLVLSLTRRMCAVDTGGWPPVLCGRVRPMPEAPIPRAAVSALAHRIRCCTPMTKHPIRSLMRLMGKGAAAGRIGRREAFDCGQTSILSFALLRVEPARQSEPIWPLS